MRTTYKTLKKGAARKFAERLKELGKRRPPQDLVDKINQNDKKKVATPRPASKDLET